MTFLLMVFDFVDRQIVVSMFPFMKAEWGLSDAQLGALVSVVSITVALGTFPVAVLVDRWSRVKSIAFMGAVWSLATIACAFSGPAARLSGDHQGRQAVPGPAGVSAVKPAHRERRSR